MSPLRQIVGGTRLTFWCPGCDGAHQVVIRTETSGHPSWEFDGNMERPTFSPSILVTCRWSADEPNDPDWQDQICHSFIKDGQIQFLADCTHALAGQTVPLPDWPFAPGEYGGIEE